MAATATKRARKTGNRTEPVLVAELPAEPIEAAKSVGLRYVIDQRPGIRRRRAGKGFRYVSPSGEPVRDRKVLARIAALAIPPAYNDVWICTDPRGHLQATGRDAKGRKQYRYHPRWSEVREKTKFGRLIAFGEALLCIRTRVEEDLKRSGMPREKVLAAVVRLLETTLIRVGNEEYARGNRSYGLTTMHDRHADIDGASVRFTFRGKGGQAHQVDIRDRRLARIVKRSQELPGQELFQYIDENDEPRTIDSGDVNAYLHEISGEAFTAKDFQTWAGTILAARALQEFVKVDSEGQAKQNVVRAIEVVAARLGNTRAVCRKSYVHPAVVDAYLDGTLVKTPRQRIDTELSENLAALSPEEAAVLAFLRARLATEADPDASKA